MSTHSKSPFYFEVAVAENPDVERFNNYADAVKYCDRHLLDYEFIIKKPNTITEKKEKGKKIIIRKPNKKKVNEATKLTQKNTGSKEEKMTSFYEEQKSMSEEVCPECGIVLGEDVPIMCYMNKKEGDSTLCYNCYWDCKYYEDDENEDNEEEIEEYKQQLEDKKVRTEYEKFKEQVNKDYTTALAYAFGISNGFSQKCVSKYALDNISDEIQAFMDSVDDVIKKEWRIKIFNHFYGYDYVWFNGEPLERDYFEGEYPKMVDKEGNKIIKLETGEYVTQKKKIKLNVVKK